MKNLSIILILILTACGSGVNENSIYCPPCEFAEISVKDGAIFDSDLNYISEFSPKNTSTNLINSFFEFDNDIYFSYNNNGRILVKNFDFDNPIIKQNFSDYRFNGSIFNDQLIVFNSFYTKTVNNNYNETGFISIDIKGQNESFYSYQKSELSSNIEHIIIKDKLIVVENSFINGDIIDLITKEILTLDSNIKNMQKGDYITRIYYFNEFYIIGIADSITIKEGNNTINTYIEEQTYFKTTDTGLVKFDILNIDKFKKYFYNTYKSERKLYLKSGNTLTCIDPFTEVIESTHEIKHGFNSENIFVLENKLFIINSSGNNTKTESDDFQIFVTDLSSGNELDFYNICNDYCTKPKLDDIAYWNGKYYFVGRFEGLY